MTIIIIVICFVLLDDLEPILALVSSWEKMEFESWPALLDEVQEQYEINAGKVNSVITCIYLGKFFFKQKPINAGTELWSC